MITNIYSLKINVSYSNFRLLINDNIVFQLNEKTPVNFVLNINEWLVNGKNKIELILNSFKEELNIDSIKYSIQVYSNTLENPKSEKQKINELFGEFHLNQDLITPVILNFQINQNFPLWLWLKSNSITNDIHTKNKLIDTYKNIWSLLKNKDIDNLIKLTNERTKEIAAAYNYDFYNKNEMAKNYFEELFSGYGLNLELEEINYDNINLVISKSHKICYLETIDGDLPIYYYNENTGMSHFVNLKFCKVYDNFIVIR